MIADPSHSNMIKIPLTGTSMWPVLKPGDTLFVEVFSHISPVTEIGDILIGRLNGEFVAHRLIHQVPHNIMKGDFGLYVDNENHPFGRVLGIERAHKVIWWGLSGQPMKKYFAYLSKIRSSEKPRILRRLALTIIHLLSMCSIPAELKYGQERS